MKFNFGTAIFTFLIMFICFLVFVVIKSRGVDHSLVSDDYYADDLKYQEQYDKLSRSMGSDLLAYNESTEHIVIKFLGSDFVEGSVSFYRPADKSLDFSTPMILDSVQTFTFPKKDLAMGKWRIKVEWDAAGKSFYKEYEYYK